MTKDFSQIKRARHPIPDYVHDSLDRAGLRQEFESRPAYQQNDYVGWITRAKREVTREKRLAQMLIELEMGGVYMGMDHPASRR